MEFYRMAGDVDYVLRIVVTDIAGYDAFYKKLIATVPLKKCHVALCDEADQVDHGAAPSRGQVNASEV
jgi:DNA-binding Lrp family transcriptional regulator